MPPTHPRKTTNPLLVDCRRSRKMNKWRIERRRWRHLLLRTRHVLGGLERAGFASHRGLDSFPVSLTSPAESRKSRQTQEIRIFSGYTCELEGKAAHLGGVAKRGRSPRLERRALRCGGTLVRRANNGEASFPTEIWPRRMVWSSRRIRVTSPVSPEARHCLARRALIQ